MHIYQILLVFEIFTGRWKVFGNYSNDIYKGETDLEEDKAIKFVIGRNIKVFTIINPGI